MALMPGESREAGKAKATFPTMFPALGSSPPPNFFAASVPLNLPSQTVPSPVSPEGNNPPDIS